VIVIVLASAPPKLRGYLTRWLMEVRAGVYVGTVTARIRETLWEHVLELAGPGEATLVYQAPGEQGFAIEAHQSKWYPVDFDGVTLMCRPSEATVPPGRQGFSRAAKQREFGPRGRSRRRR